MKCHFLLLLVVVLAACNAPKPVMPSITPVVSPSLVPSSAPVDRPPPIPSALAPTAEPTRAPDQAAPEVLLPVIEKTIDLGQVDFGNSLSSRPAVLDDQADRLYLSLSPSRTIVLHAETLTPIGEIPFGGALSINSSAQRLYIGVPGNSAYNPDGTSVITPAELKLFDTSNLALLRSVIFSDTSTVTPLVAVDPVNNKAYVTQDGITLVDATTLEVQGTLSGTFPLPDSPVPNYTAVDAAILPQQQRLFVSLNNGIPGANNGNVVAVYDLVTDQVIARDSAPSVSGFAVDETTGVVFSPRSNMSTNAIVKYDAQGQVLKRLEGTSGAVLVDLRHDRVYLFQWRDQTSLKVLDRDLNFLGVVRFPEITMPQLLLTDPKHDRVLVLQNGGRLFVLTGQGEPLGPLDTATLPKRYAVQSILPSAHVETERSLLAIFAPDEYTTAQGSAFRSDNGGATWQFVSGLPADTVTDLKFADQMTFAAVGGNGTTDGYGIWRSSDGGQTWQPASHELTDLGVMHLAVSPDFARDGTLYALSKRGAFRSMDRGATWTSLAVRYAPLLKDLTVSFSAVAVSPNFAGDNTLLIGHSSSLWRSTDRGETWINVDGGPAATRLAYAPTGSIVFAINYEGAHRSTDGGLTWSNISTGLDLSNNTLEDVQVSDREALVLLRNFDQLGTLYRLPLNETTWQQVPLEADVTALARLPDQAMGSHWLAASPAASLSVSHDGGLTWQPWEK